MLGWLFPPSCPCDPAAKAWVEERLEWLAEEFDDHAFNGRRIVLPTRGAIIPLESVPPLPGRGRGFKNMRESVSGPR